MNGTTTHRQALAWAEILLCIAPVSLLWAMLVPGMLAVAGSERHDRVLMLFLLVGGSVGLPALWSLVLPAARGRASPRFGALRVGAIGLGVLACAMCLVWLCERGRSPAEDPSAWITVYAAASPIIVALHQIAAAAVQRREPT